MTTTDNGKASGPDEVRASKDPGDETARRFHYQWTFAAVVCLMLLDDTEDVAEVLCEQHEDVLIKHEDGNFSGLQVKTRATDRPRWRTSDDRLVASFARFAQLEVQFPRIFRAFRFLTNHPLHSAKNGQDVKHVLSEIRASSTIGDLTNVVGRFLRRVAEVGNCTEDTAFEALSKASASDDLPKLRDIQVRLISELIRVWELADERTYATVVRAASRLADECGRASSLVHEEVLPTYLPVVTEPDEAELAACLANKRFDRVRVISVLGSALTDEALLEGAPGTLAVPGSGDAGLLSTKLEAGGFSAVSFNSAKDLRDKADYLAIVWTKKHGHEEGLQRYGHVRSIVLSEAASAFESTKQTQSVFGTEMLETLRARLRDRFQEGTSLFDCSLEHLEGFAYSLTSECEVQWSLSRPWEE